MTEEEFFINNYPDSCYGDRPLSPHWDFFQDGVEFGERKSKKKIEELEAQLAISEHDREHNDYELTEVYKKVEELEKENIELKEHHKNVCENLTNTHRNIREQLIKAKEIIENLLGLLPDEVLNHDYYKEKYVDPAEQFLSEVEK